MEFIVGYTGFVGSNIIASHTFDGMFNSKNITEAYGKNPDLLVYSGVPAEMFLANQNPEADKALMDQAIENIKRINPKKIVLISTIAVYQDPDGVDEDYQIDETTLTAYGANRLYLERWVEANMSDYHIVRLPGLYGKNLKKNFIYDFIHYVPPMLNEAKYKELSAQEELIKTEYVLQDNGFYKCMLPIDAKEERTALKEAFRRVGFSALNFTDSRGTFQYYNLANLWQDIQIAIEHKIQKLNLAVEPITISELYQELTGEVFVNELPKAVPYFNYKTKHEALWDGANGYIHTKEEVLADVKAYINSVG
ncbi:MAG: NAD-dependent epimerase/dehydratase family protein [Roseburia sp.]|nr:NAD-dependent epimerase/dehydratase family protein [Roseburia sp.]